MENEAILSSRKMKFYTRIFFRIIRCVDSITFLAIIIYHYFNRFRANNFLKKKNELQRIVKIFKQFEISSSKHFALRKSELTGRNGVLARKEKVVAKKGGGIERKRGGRSIEFGARGSPFFFSNRFRGYTAAAHAQRVTASKLASGTVNGTTTPTATTLDVRGKEDEQREVSLAARAYDHCRPPVSRRSPRAGGTVVRISRSYKPTISSKPSKSLLLAIFRARYDKIAERLDRLVFRSLKLSKIRFNESLRVLKKQRSAYPRRGA